MNIDYDAIVIGAGHNGLTASVLLARKGQKVLCLEKNNRVGGMVIIRELFNGYKHNVGAWVPIVFRDSIMDKIVLTHKYFEKNFGITGGDFAHGLIQPSHWWDKRPVEGWSNYRTALENLYMCGSSAHPGPGVTCIPGYNAANTVLKDRGINDSVPVPAIDKPKNTLLFWKRKS